MQTLIGIDFTDAQDLIRDFQVISRQQDDRFPLKSGRIGG